jgi:hypothetical protein
MNVTYSPTSTSRELTEEEEEEMDRLYLAGRDDEAYAIREAAEGSSRVYEGRLYHWNGQEWRIVAKPHPGKHHPEPATLADIFIEAKDNVWAVGHNWCDPARQRGARLSRRILQRQQRRLDINNQIQGSNGDRI